MSAGETPNCSGGLIRIRLEDIRHTQRIEAVIFNGNLYDRAALDRILNHVERQARSWAIACKIVWRFVKKPTFY